jgi:hypothetical protein
MVRGKYTVRAAQGRAESAGQRADRAAQLLAEERAAHTAEVAELKGRIEKLSSQLVGSVKELAAAEVERTEAEWAARLAAEKQRQHDTALKVFNRIGQAITFSALNGGRQIEGISGNMVLRLLPDLAQMLDVPAGTAHEIAVRGSELQANRDRRRTSANRLRAAAAGQPITVTKGSER